MFKKRKKLKTKIICIFTVIAILFLSAYLDNTIDEIINPLVIKNAEEIINAQMNLTVEELLKSEKFCDVSFINSDTDFTKLNWNAVNNFKTAVINTSQARLDNYKNLVTYVQLGSLTSSAFLSNRGPDIPILFDFYCSVNASIDSNITSSEINRAMHTVSLNVVTKYSIILLNGEYSAEIKSNYILSETLFSGDTPNFYGTHF